jgi:hypothetical protein
MSFKKRFRLATMACDRSHLKPGLNLSTLLLAQAAEGRDGGNILAQTQHRERKRARVCPSGRSAPMARNTRTLPVKKG